MPPEKTTVRVSGRVGQINCLKTLRLIGVCVSIAWQPSRSVLTRRKFIMVRRQDWPQKLKISLHGDGAIGKNVALSILTTGMRRILAIRDAQTTNLSNEMTNKANR